ncbi:MAG: TfoX/Sxy family protein [Clostridiales bacterium]|nr:TfoX/Sxy family protein [Clostridiales bacterium]
MATSVDFIQFICEQISGNYSVTYKKMFGEYIVYVNEKPVLLVCDNTVYVKKLAELKELMKNADCGVPYGGAKEHYILDVENAELTEKAIEILERITPLPKKKAKPRTTAKENE